MVSSVLDAVEEALPGSCSGLEFLQLDLKDVVQEGGEDPKGGSFPPCS